MSSSVISGDAIRFGSQAATPAALVGAVVAAYCLTDALAAPGLVGIMVVLLGLTVALVNGAGSRSVLTLAALVPVLDAGSAPGWAWAAGAALLIAGSVPPLADAPAAGSKAPLEHAGLERHLSRCRRQGAVAHLLVGALPPQAPRGGYDMLAMLRIADSAEIVPRRGGADLVVLVDPEGLDREQLERRLTVAAQAPLRFGWAIFPQDGVTLRALIDHARADSLARSADPRVLELVRKAP